jgi:hypothetical protein
MNLQAGGHSELDDDLAPSSAVMARNCPLFERAQNSRRLR